ncbi:MAG: YegS/Rv2252/BmrU family lipid kinase [Ruminococcus sp.]|nr:YegS/Rv2252/BmrU family lipid kinase [Ruminococcus sp.]
MQKLYFIVNLLAGRATIGDKLGEIINEFNKANFEVTVHITQSGTDAADSAQYACGGGFDLIVCAGGDGTLSQCLQGMMRSGRRIPIGYLPAGSTNDFARSLGIPKSIMDAVKWITGGTPTPCDIGAFNDEYFSYIVAFGAFTSVAYETSQQVKNVLGHVSYILNGLTQLSTLRSKSMRIEYDDNVIEGDYIFGMVTNSASVAGLLSMSDFYLDDGVFEVTLIKKPANLIQLQQIVHSLLNISVEIDKDYIKFFRTNKITFTSLDSSEITWTRDGEYGGNAAENVICNCQRAIPFMIGERGAPVYDDPIENYLANV